MLWIRDSLASYAEASWQEDLFWHGKSLQWTEAAHGNIRGLSKTHQGTSRVLLEKRLLFISTSIESTLFCPKIALENELAHGKWRPSRDSLQNCTVLLWSEPRCRHRLAGLPNNLQHIYLSELNYHFPVITLRGSGLLGNTSRKMSHSIITHHLVN